jgi:hypothetical protein
MHEQHRVCSRRGRDRRQRQRPFQQSPFVLLQDNCNRNDDGLDAGDESSHGDNASIARGELGTLPEAVERAFGVVLKSRETALTSCL